MSCASDVQRALLLRGSFPVVEPLELLDLVFEGRVLLPEDCAELRQDHALTPAARAFVAAAFDRGMTEAEWLGWQTPPAHPQLQDAVRCLWHELVIPAFTSRYTGQARLLPSKLDIPTQRAFRAM